MRGISKKPGGFLNLFKDTYRGVVIIVTTPFRVVSVVRELLRNGCLTVETAFSYEQNPFYIRTFIQPDADIVTIVGIPHLNEIPLNELELDEKGSRFLLEQYEKHNKRIVTAFEDIQGRRDFFGFMIDTSLVTSNLYPFYDAFMSQSQESYVMAGVVAVATVAFRMYAKKFVIGKIVKGIYFLAKKWVSNKMKK